MIIPSAMYPVLLCPNKEEKKTLWSSHYAIYFTIPTIWSFPHSTRSLIDSGQSTSVVCGRMVAIPSDERACKVGNTCSPQLLSLYTDIREIFLPLCNLARADEKLGENCGMKWCMIVVQCKQNSVVSTNTRDWHQLSHGFVANTEDGFLAPVLLDTSPEYV